MSNPIIAAIDRSEATDSATLNLVDVTIVSAVGASMHPPAVRVAAPSVAAWWITDFEVKEPKGGSSVAVGFSF